MLTRFALSFRTSLFLTSATLVLAACSAVPGAKTATKASAESSAGPTMLGKSAVDAADPMDDRVSALERKVIGLQTEVAAARPVLKKVDAMERNFKALSLELDRIDLETSAASAPPPSSSPSSSTVKPSAAADAGKESVAVPDAAKTRGVVDVPTGSGTKAALENTRSENSRLKRTYVPAPTFSQAPVKKDMPLKAQGPAVGDRDAKLAVRNVRIGQQEGATRIVLDTNKAARINYDLDNDEKIMVIEVPDAGWATARASDVASSPLVASYKAESDEKGSRLILQLKGEAKVLATARLKPGQGSGDRVYLDIAPKN